jgi:mono/diheme cytochrome c family protein
MKGIAALACALGLVGLYGVGVCDEPVNAAEAAKTAKVADAKPVFLKYKCNSCHTIESQAITKKAVAGEAEAKGDKPPDLSGVGLDRNATWIVSFLQKKEKLDGKLHIKKFRGTDSELQKLAGWLASMKDEAAAKKMKADEEKNEKSETK